MLVMALVTEAGLALAGPMAGGAPASKNNVTGRFYLCHQGNWAGWQNWAQQYAARAVLYEPKRPKAISAAPWLGCGGRSGIMSSRTRGKAWSQNTNDPWLPLSWRRCSGRAGLRLGATLEGNIILAHHSP